MKQLLREKHLRKRKQLREGEVKRKSRAICEKLVSCPEFKRARKLFFYHPANNEADCLPALKKALQLGKKVFLPRVKGKTLEAVEVKGIAELKKLRKGAFGIPAPTGRAVELSEIDLVVVPAIAFDSRGFRLGYGKGYYDSMLEKTRVEKIGLCYEQNLVERLPAEKHDERVDKIITEKKVIKPVRVVF